MNRRFLGFLMSLMTVLTAAGQSAHSVQWRYIETYRELAIDQMQRYQVPASITLAQALCESGAGQSRLAREAHNHFGIKVGTGWKGSYIVMADDRPNDRFRKYGSDAESYEDHSRFLRNNPRYNSLFQLKLTDYKGWAHGLKRCGYATNPNYGTMLIGIIERYNLSQFDSYTSGRYHAKTKNRSSDAEKNRFFAEHIIYRNNGCFMLVANADDTWESIARETGTKPWRLLKWNDLPPDYILRTGDIVYLQKKKKRADKSYKYVPHLAQPGESLHAIAQRYAIRLASLYKMNRLPADYELQTGDLLRVR